MIDRPVEEVWEFLTDLSKLPKWNFGVEAKQTSAGPLGAGTTLQLKASRMVYSARILEFESGKKWTFEFSSGPFKGSIENSSVEKVEGMARFTRKADLKFSGAYKLLGPFLTPRLKKEYAASVGNLKRMLESEAQSKVQGQV